MKRTIFSVLALLSLCVSTAAGEDIRWTHDLREAAKLAADSHRPMVVHFYADWCGPCVRLDRVVFTDRHLVKDVNENVIAVRLNVDQHPEIANHFGVRAVPTDVYLSPTGEVVARRTSPKTAAEYRLLIQQLKVYLRVGSVDR